MKLFGEKSVEVAKTQRIIGTIYILMKNSDMACEYLNKALQIFNELGYKK